MIRTLANAAGVFGMVGGQQADVLAERTEGSVELLQFIHTHKTAKLIQASVVIGSLFAPLSAAEQAAVSLYGEAVGVAFQMVDDWLDVAGEQEQLGKPVGSDERLEKLTYPRLVGLDETLRMAEEKLAEAKRALTDADVHAPLLFGIGEFIVHRNK
ncbi:hypothetical protein GCM10025857_37670 [Alicyclobacillus contaminans]|nr:hypothetical protein GCM10025857_37670 [Alicyclobacillus contaminans]